MPAALATPDVITISDDVVALNRFLAPLLPYLEQAGVTELSVNKPQEIFTLINGEKTRHAVPDLDYQHLRGFAGLVASFTQQYIGDTNPLLSATLPQGYRIQFVIPPACDPNTILLSIRRQDMKCLTLADYLSSGVFADESTFEQFVNAIFDGQTILISGGPNSGKSTFLNACLATLPHEERILVVEDAKELILPHSDIARLYFSRGEQGVANVKPWQLLEACLRLRPDRILFGELRGDEADAFLAATNSGITGSMTTIHAKSPLMALEKLATLALKATRGYSKQEMDIYIRQTIDVVVQIGFNKQGERRINEVHYVR